MNPPNGTLEFHNSTNGFAAPAPTHPTFPHWMPHQSAAVPVPMTAPNHQIWQNRQLTGWPMVRRQGLPAPNKKTKRVRTAFITNQLLALENEFNLCRYLAPERRLQLADILHINERAIKIWFQNRRMKQKKGFLESQATSDESSEHSQSPIMYHQGVIPNHPGVRVPTTPNLTSEQPQYSPYMYGSYPPANVSALPWHPEVQVPTQLGTSLSSAATVPTALNLMAQQPRYSPYTYGIHPSITPLSIPAQLYQSAVQASPQLETSHPLPNLMSEHHQYSPDLYGNTHRMFLPGNIPPPPLQPVVQDPTQRGASLSSAEEPASDVSNEHHNSSWDPLQFIDDLLL
ncbi:homeobox protein Hox-A3-like [Spodoptera litura]|uniref:Homeobox protein Hox-A3-like n=1 Tax=Spodoptera litura TaxID=69820 RepID=A0A9J7E8X3_SPOLT|nr:homeobox protein Hox-A3-like [Spodoptera litura]